ncbi:MAG: bifunctional DNA-formamidopyrimidine glycosylase/DNA-(apurinic or apyrimidinic site) lyase [Terracidiphilus sp.]|jgi:formamidopyrimidine-DNA glycosylase
MPELPEVETIARGVNERIRGDRIVEVWFSRHPQPFKTPAARQARELEGRGILAVHRTGKHIVCELGGPADGSVHSHPRSPQQAKIARRGPRSRKNKDAARVGHPGSGLGELENEPAAQWIVHLGMTGRLLVTTPDASIAAHTHARLSLLSGRELRFVDPRRFGRLEFRDLSRRAGFCAAGIDPLTVTAEEFARLFRGRKLAIKAALLNQKLLSGVGNIYADESLFRAGIRPRRRSGRLSRAELEGLRLALREVLKHAIRLGGSSVSDYVDADGVRGFFQQEHCVYLRTGLPCRLCQTPIRRIVVAGRGTHYCPRCQR